MPKEEIASLKMELEAARRELEQARLSLRTTADEETRKTVKRDLSLQNMIRPWGGSENEILLEEFLSDLEAVAHSGGWTESDLKLVCRLKVTGRAAACILAHPELRDAASTFDEYKRVLKERFGELATPAQRLLELNLVMQRQGESALEFADRVRRLGERTVARGQEDGSLKWEKQQVDSLILAAFIKGLRGEAAAQLHYNPPTNFQEAVSRAARVELYQGSSSRVINSVEEQGTSQVAAAMATPGRGSRQIRCFRCNQEGHVARDCAQLRRGVSRNAREGSQEKKKQWKDTNPGGAPNRPFCFVCGSPWHFARNCPDRAKEARAASNFVDSSSVKEASPKAAGSA